MNGVSWARSSYEEGAYEVDDTDRVNTGFNIVSRLLGVGAQAGGGLTAIDTTALQFGAGHLSFAISALIPAFFMRCRRRACGACRDSRSFVDLRDGALRPLSPNQGRAPYRSSCRSKAAGQIAEI